MLSFADAIQESRRAASLERQFFSPTLAAPFGDRNLRSDSRQPSLPRRCAIQPLRSAAHNFLFQRNINVFVDYLRAIGTVGRTECQRRPPMPRITKRLVDAAEIRPAEYFVWDSEIPGFGLRVLPSGRRGYAVQYRAGRRSRRISLGPARC